MIYMIILYIAVILFFYFFAGNNNILIHKQNQNKAMMFLTEDIAKQLIDRCYNNLNHYNTLYMAHIAIFTTLFTILIGFYSNNDYSFIIQNNISKQNEDLCVITNIDNTTNQYQDINTKQNLNNKNTIKFEITLLFIPIFLYLYLSMKYVFIQLTNHNNLIKLLEFKLDIPYSYITTKGYYVLKWNFIDVYAIINYIIAIILCIITIYGTYPFFYEQYK